MLALVVSMIIVLIGKQAYHESSQGTNEKIELQRIRSRAERRWASEVELSSIYNLRESDYLNLEQINNGKLVTLHLSR